jgi:hypothetical protein
MINFNCPFCSSRKDEVCSILSKPIAEVSNPNLCYFFSANAKDYLRRNRKIFYVVIMFLCFMGIAIYSSIYGRPF